MAAGPARIRGATTTHRAALLPASSGHPLNGESPPDFRAHAIEDHLAHVSHALAWSRTTLRECGFLAYATPTPHAEWAEDMSYGEADSISWHWREQQATVGFSFHTHPGQDAACLPSGLDVMGAMVRGDHLHYVMTLDGRVTGWRFREPASEARAILRAMRVLSRQRALTKPFVTFLECSLEAALPFMVEPAYAARLVEGAGGGARFERAHVRDVLTGPEKRMHRFPEFQA